MFNVEHDDDGEWLNGNYYNADNELDLDNLWLVSIRNCLYFSPAPAGEFCFFSWPYQPPSIFPVYIEKNINYLQNTLNMV